MNNSSIPQDVVDALIQRRGRLHVIEALDPEKTALIVIDMQNFFVEEGQPSEVPAARDIVPNINRLAEATRGVGSSVFWVRVTLTEEVFEEWSVFLDYRDAGGGETFSGLEAGHHGHALWHKLDVHDTDLVVDKTRFSAFIQGSSELDTILRERGVDTLLIVGTLTNVCCESTARDAMMLNYRSVLVSDANAAVTDFEHQASLVNVLQFFGDVYTTDETIGMLQTRA
jgi:ureidoacrylate peracid hydrolase